MKNLIKVLLATLMLVGFSTTSFAWVDCDGLEGYKSSSPLGFKHDLGQCTTFQFLYGNTDRDWVSKKTGIIRYANEEWNGINEYADGVGELFSRSSSRKKNASSYSQGKAVTMILLSNMDVKRVWK